nr:hypothetical protein [Tanacetum cinerariifolium]
MLNVDVEPLNPRLLNNSSAHSDYLKHTQEEAAALRKIVEQGKSKNFINAYLDSTCKYTKQIQEFLIIVEQTCPSFNNSKEKLVAVIPKNKDKRVRFTKPVTSSGNTNIKTASSSNLVSNKLALSYTGVEPSTSASGSQPSGNTKKDKIQRPPSSTQKNKVEAHPRTVKYSLKNKNGAIEHKRNASVQRSKLNVNSKLKYVTCNGCMFSDIHDLCVLEFINDMNAHVKSKSVKKSLKRKVWKPTGKVPSRKPIAVETDKPKPVATLVYSRKPRTSKSTNPDRKSKQNDVVERRNRTLIEAARTMLIHAKALFFLWAEAVATACYTQNHSTVRLRHSKTPYELLHVELPNLSFFHVFGALCYPTNDSENFGKLQPKADIAMASEHSSSGLVLHEMTPATISSGLMPNPPHSTLFIPPSRIDWDMLFQPLFDKLLTSPPSVDHPAPEVITLIAEVVAPKPTASSGSPSTTTIDQDAPSPSNSQTTPDT